MKYDVQMSRTDSFKVTVEAESPEEAEETARDILENCETPWSQYGDVCNGYDHDSTEPTEE